MKIKTEFRKDINDLDYWPLTQSYIETEEYEYGYTKLDTGESVFPVPKRVMNTLKNLDVRYYPGISNRLLRMLAIRDKVSERNIFLGNGSLELIEIICKLFIDPGDTVILSDPTYPMYEYFVKLTRGKVLNVRRDSVGYLDATVISKSIQTNTKLIFIDNPSNPFGSFINQDTIEQILKLGLITVVDEAYYEYVGKSCISLLNRYSNLIVLRTFSKTMGIAGIRLGYLMTSEIIMRGIMKVKTPHQVNIVAQFLAQGILETVDIPKRMNQLIAGRVYLIKQLSKISYLKTYDSQGAYIVVQITSKLISKDIILQRMRESKVLIKSLDFPNMSNDFLRINVVPKYIAKRVITIFQSLQ